MANKRTIINADEELVIQGKLTIEGEFVQKEFVETVSYTESKFLGDILVVNADGYTLGTSNVATNATLRLRSGSSNADIVYNGTALVIEQDVYANVYGNVNGNVTGTASSAEALTSAVTIALSGDAGGSATFINAGDTATISTTLATVNSTTGTFGSASNTIDSITVNAKGLVTEITQAPISITNSQVTDFVSGVRTNVSVTDAGGDGSLSYNSTSGVFTYTGPSASEVRAHFSASNGVDYNSATGAFQAVESEIQHDSLDGFVADEHVAHSGVSLTAGAGLTGGGDITASRTFDVVGGFGITVNANNIESSNSDIRSLFSATDTGGDGSFSYNNSTGVFTYTGPSASEARAHFSVTDTGGDGSLSYSNTTGVFTYTGPDQDEANARITAAPDQVRAHISHVDNGGDGSLSYNSTTGVITYTGPSATEVRAHFSGDDGITLTDGSINVDNTVVRTSGDQTISGVKTFTGNVDLTNAWIEGGITIRGDLDIIGDINSVTQTDSFITDTSITLRQGATTNGDAHIYVVATGDDPYLKWNTGTSRWQFSDGATDYNMLTEADVEGFFSVTDLGGDGSLTYANGVFTYTGPSASEVRQHISVSNSSGFGNLAYASGTGVITYVGVSINDIRQQISAPAVNHSGDGGLSYNETNGEFTYTGPNQDEANSRILGAPDQVRSHFLGGYAIDITDGTVSLDTVPDTITFDNGRIKLLDDSVAVGNAAGSFTVGTSNTVSIGFEAGSTNQRSYAVGIGAQAGRLDQSEASIAIGFQAGRSYQGGNVVNASSIAIGSYAGYLSQSPNTVAVGTSAGLFQQGTKSVAVGFDAGNVAQGEYSVAIGPEAGKTNQPANSIVIRAGDISYPDVNGAEEGALYISPIRHGSEKMGNVLMYDSANAEVRSIDNTVFVSSSFDQTIAGVKTFTDELVIPDSATTRNGAIYFDASTDKAYIRINGTTQEITPAVSVGTVADAGTTGVNIYGGNIATGNTTTHYIRSIDAGTYTTISESANVITIDGDSSAIRGLFSVSDTGGDGSLTYNNTTGTFTYTGPSASEVRAHFSAGSGITLVNGVISATGDNYGSWSVQTDSGSGSKEAVSSNETLQIVGGTNITVTNVGNIVTIRNDNTSDITSVTAGSGLTGGGSAGAVTLNIGAGTGVTVGADSISIGQDVATTSDVTFGTLDVSGDAIIEGNLTVNGTTTTVSAVSLSISDNMIYLNANSNTANPDLGFAGNYNDGTYAHAGFFRDATDGYWKVFDSYTPEPDEAVDINTGHATFSLADIRADTFRGNVVVPGAYSLPTADGTINQVLATNGSGQLTFKDVTTIGGTITGVNAGSGLTGGGIAGTVTLNVGAGTGITVNANDIAVNMGDFDTGDLSEGTNLYFTAARVRGNISASGDLSYNSTTGEISFTERTDAEVRGLVSASGDLSYNNTTGVFSFTERTDAEVRGLISGGTGISYNNTTGVIALSDTGYVSGVTAGTGLTGGGNSGNVTLNVSGLTTSEIAAGSLLTSAEGFVDSDTQLMTAAAIADKIESYGYTTEVGDITGVTAGTGLTGGGTSGTVTLNIGAGAGITVNANDIALTSGIVAAGSKGSASKSISATVDTYGRVTAFSDQDIAIASSQVSGLAASATTDTTNASNITSGTLASARLPNLTVADFAGAAIQTGSESFADSDTVLMTAAAVQDKILSYNYSTVNTLKAVQTLGLVTLQMDDAAGIVDEVLLDSTNHITIASGGPGVITFGTDATSANTASTIVSRDSSGNFSAGVVTATATSARYADLAEKYATDITYAPGTVVVFGGDAEVTACEADNSPRVAGIISTDPAYMMNSEAEGQYVALRGRVPCMVIGKVRKGDVLITSEVPGHAKVSDQPHFVGAACIVGKAIGNKDDDGPGVVEVLV
jgi:hypothetical protein